MQAYQCSVCNFLYDDETADKNAEGALIPFEELDSEWVCPICSVRAELFLPTDSDRVHDILTDNK